MAKPLSSQQSMISVSNKKIKQKIKKEKRKKESFAINDHFADALCPQQLKQMGINLPLICIINSQLITFAMFPFGHREGNIIICFI